MMRIEITHQELESILVCNESEFKEKCQNFLQIPKTFYYCYGYMPDVSCLEISMSQLEKILSHNKKSRLHDTLNSIYRAGKVTAQSSVWIYGRNKI